MSVGLLLVDCLVEGSRSLKDKRRVLTSLTARLRREFNIALCEVEHQDQWQRSRLAVVLVNTEWPMIERSVSRIAEFIEHDRRLSVLETETQRLY